ncbi:MAG TPA: tetratricopeptide repeat protein [Acidobacteriota bacterium]
MEAKQNFYTQGFQAFAKRDYDRAIELFQQALAQDPAFAIAQQNLAEAYCQKGEYDLAVESIRKVIEAQPNNVLAHTALSRYYQKKGMIPEAEYEMMIANSLRMS